MAPVERERPERLKPIGEWKGESLSSVDGISSGGDLNVETRDLDCHALGFTVYGLSLLQHRNH
jgi:hypothetical protein